MRKLLRRRRADSSSGPVVEYARILDGESLWVSVLGAGADAGLGLQTYDGAVVRLVDDTGEEPSGARLTVRSRLSDALPDAADGGTLVLLDRADHPTPLAAAGDALADSAVMRIPETPDGRWQYELGQRRGAVTVHRHPAEPAVPLVSAFEMPDAIGIDVRLPREVTRPRLVLVRAGDASGQLGTVSGEPEPEPEEALTAALPGEHVVRFRVTDLDVPLEPGLEVQPMFEDGDGRRPVRRQRNALRDASSAVNHPTIFADPGQQVPRLRLHFDGEGRVLLRRVEAGEG